ncbi:MAG: DUF5685 family protein [Planctomycetaceae bacterium]
MFGFLSPQQRIPEWRRSYARVCQYQRKLFGLTSLPFLSYEATFLYQLAIDFGLIARLATGSPECCRLRRLPNDNSPTDAAAASFVSAFGMMLLGVKLKDDVQDSGRWHHRFLEWKYRRPVRRAERMLGEMASNIPDVVQQALVAHTQLESNRTIALTAYAAPTAKAFAAVFAGFAEFLSAEANGGTDDSPSAEVVTTFGRIGHSVGAAIIAWDCAVDFEDDRLRGNFNPLRDTTDVGASLEFALLQLSRIGWELPAHSTAATVIASVSTRVRHRQCRPRTVCSPDLMERWGLRRQRGYTYAKCDGCEVVCAGAECSGACAEICAPAFLCCDPGCGACGCVPHTSTTPQSSETNQEQTPLPNPYEHLHDKHGTAAGDLNPAGYIVIDGDRVPAKSMSGKYIDDQTEIRVVQTDSYGVSVVPNQDT